MSNNVLDSLNFMLLKEVESLGENENIREREPKEILLSIKFKDGHIHHVFPNSDDAKEMIESAAEVADTPITLGVKGDKKDKVDDFSKKIPNRIIFHNRQAIGDILMFTSGIRDFKKAFPHVRVKVMSTAMHIWDNNKNLDWTKWDSDDIIDLGNGKKNEEAVGRAIKEDKAVVVYIGPSRGTNESNRRDRHFANAYRLSIQDHLGISFDQGPIRPDIWLTEEEYNAPPIIDGKYWIIVAGEKGDWTAKTYPFERWQEVVNAFPDLQFVQIGSKSHKHPELKGNNVVNMIGKTEGRTDGIRKLFNLFLNADGSAGLVSFQMHLAGAFNLPCVVIAGAREPVWFTKYPGHRYLATDGCLPCTVDGNGMTTACWFCDVDRCKYTTDKKVPKCVDIIPTTTIIDAIKSYYDGGRLSRSENKKLIFKNIVKENKDCTILFKKAEVPKTVQGLPAKYGMEFGGGSLTDRDWLFMSQTIDKFGVKTVLEFGTGLSTLLLLEKGLKVVSYESKENWAKKVKALHPNADIRIWDGKNFPDTIEKFDMVFVDGPAGGINREISTKVGADSADIVIIHDANREYERKWQDKYIKGKFNKLTKGGHRSHLWLKDSVSPNIPPKITIQPTNSKGSVKILFNGRGDGGAERSVTWIANRFIELGYNVSYYSPNGQPCATFKWHGSEAVHFDDMQNIFDPCDFLLFYVNDWCWELDTPKVNSFFEKPFSAKRKVMCLNFHLGGSGKAEWTRDWDQYLFLNSKLEGELLFRNSDVKTKIMAPPIANLREFFGVNPIYNDVVRIVRHSSQGNAKYPKQEGKPNFNEMVSSLLECRNDLTMSLMPAPTFLEVNDPRLIIYKRNDPPVPEFLASGNLFWYVLPSGYTEGGPKVIMEAMASGIPCVSHNHSGMKDRITEESGWRCETFDEMKEIIRNVTPTILKEKGEAARQRAKEEFVPENWINAILDK